MLSYTLRTYSEALATQPEVLYITYATLSHENNCDIISFAKFEERGLVENERKISEDELIFASIDESSTYNDSDDRYIYTNALEEIRDINYIHPDINARDDRFKTRDRIIQAKNKWKVGEISVKSMGKVLHKVFKAVVNEVNNT